MRALVIDGARDVRVTDVPRQPIAEGDVRVRISRVGLCGTDYALAQGQLGLNAFPVIPGHEVVGVVEESRSMALSVGDRVALDPLLNCGSCWACHTNHPQWCTHVGVIGVVRSGGLQEELVLPAPHWIRIPPSVELSDAVLLEPAHVVDTIISGVDIPSIRRVLVIGTGALGLLLIKVLRHIASELSVWAYDTVSQRLDRAVQEQAEPWSSDSSNSVDLVIDGVGSPESAVLTAQAVRPGGRILIYGVPKPGSSVSTADVLFRKNVQVNYSRLYSHDFAAALRWIESGWITANDMVSDTLTLEDAVGFLRDARWQSPDRWGKTVVALDE